MAILLAALWLVLWRQLSGEWSVNDQYSYGWFVPIFALFLFWQRWEDRPKAADRGQRSEIGSQTAEDVEARVPTRTTGILAAEDPATRGHYTETSEGSSRFQVSDFRFQIGGAAIGILALLLLLPIRLFEIANPDWRPLSWLHAVVVITLTLLIIWDAGGTPWVRHFAFPILFVFVAVPWITPIEMPIVQGLMRLVATIASEAVSLFGIPARLEGNLIRINNGLVGVNEACSGVRSLQTSLMIGLLFGELKRLSIWQRVALVAAAVGIAFLGNCVRAFFLVWVAATKNIAAVDRWHDLAGYSIVAAVFVGSLLLARLFGRRKVESREEDVIKTPAGVEARVPTRITNSVAAEDSRHYTETSEVNGQSIVLISALIWIALVEIAVATWYRAHERNLVATARWEVQWPQGEQNFHEIKIDETVQRILRFDHGQAAAWTWPGFATLDLATSFTARPPICSLFFFRWNPGKNSALLANLHRPDVCLPAVGWEQVADTGVKNYPVSAGFALPFRHFEFRHAARDNPVQQVAHAFYCLWEDRAPAAQRLQMTTFASTWTRGERVRAVLEGRRHLGQQVVEFVIQTRGPIEPDQAEARFGEALPKLITVRRD
jgi:exosortase